MNRGKIICFGEIMCRLSTEGYLRFSQANRLELCYGGAESNVAVSLSLLGLESAMVTKFPDNDIADCAVRELKKFGVDTGFITRGGERIGLYYLEKGASQRPSKVIYDRKHSAFSESLPGDFDWDRIFDGAAWFHFTGITPALSENLPSICLEAVKAAKARGIKVSFDPNYRSSLWSREKASEIMDKLMPYVDVCIANEGSSADVFGIKTDTPGRDGMTVVARAISEKYGCKTVALTSRGSTSASDNDWSAMLLENGRSYFSKEYRIHIVDRVGGGDAFAAGLIYSMICGSTPTETIEFATAASCLKHSIEGDICLASAEEIRALAGGDGSGRIKR